MQVVFCRFGSTRSQVRILSPRLTFHQLTFQVSPQKGPQSVFKRLAASSLGGSFQRQKGSAHACRARNPATSRGPSINCSAGFGHACVVNDSVTTQPIGKTAAQCLLSRL